MVEFENFHAFFPHEQTLATTIEFGENAGEDATVGFVLLLWTIDNMRELPLGKVDFNKLLFQIISSKNFKNNLRAKTN